MRTRALMLVTTLTVAVVVAACGRASEEEINAALGITPTPTRSAAEIATGTAQAVAFAATRTAAAEAAALSGTPGAAAAVGDVTQGQRQFLTWCVGCHRVGGGGRASDITAAGSNVPNLSDAEITALIREGANHTPPGPYKTTEISDKQINDVIAFLRSKVGS